MKQASLLIILCTLFSLGIMAQTTTIEKNANRITITTTKVDDNGKAVTETWIAEGEEPETILKDMAVNPDVLQKIDVENQIITNDGERLFLFRSAGDEKAIEGRLNQNIESYSDGNGNEQIIIINGNKNGDCGKLFEKIGMYHGEPAHAEVWVRGYDKGDHRQTNCAALGVLVDNVADEGGSRINSLIENGGAQAAGLMEGDVIFQIDEFEVSAYSSLHLALSHFKPGDIVTVRYIREDKKFKAKVELKDWAQLPGHEWRARTDCGEDEVVDEEDLVIDEGGGLSGTPGIQPLVLQDAKVFPNPTEGVFAFAFHTEPGPLTVSVTDVNGKVVFTEDDDNASGSYYQEIDLKGVPQGNYFISVKQGDKMYTNQISKQ